MPSIGTYIFIYVCLCARACKVSHTNGQNALHCHILNILLFGREMVSSKTATHKELYFSNLSRNICLNRFKVTGYKNGPFLDPLVGDNKIAMYLDGEDVLDNVRRSN